MRTATLHSVTTRLSAWLFGFVVAVCLAQIGWWIYFQIRETDHVERAAMLIRSGKPAEAARVLGADESGSLTEQAHRRRVMFVSEGATLGLLALLGIVFFYARMVRERRMLVEQERFLTGATHELKTPLSALRLGLESMLAKTVPPEKNELYLHAMVEQVERLETDVTNLLTAAGIQGGDRRLTLDGVDVGIAVTEAAAEFRSRFDAAGIGLDAESVVPVRMSLDRAALRTILRNLLDNALKYCGQGHHVAISLRDIGGEIELKVTDDGPGMTAEGCKRAFERFYRGAGTEHVGGAGLGLHLVEQLAAAHGGRAAVASPGPGLGTEFVVLLPQREETA